MTASSPPKDPKDIQVVGPGEQAPAQPVPIDPGPPEDRILTPEETENFFKHGTFDVPAAPVAPVKPDGQATEAAQRASAQEFFATPTATQEPHRAPAVELTQEQKDAAVAAATQPAQPSLPGLAPPVAPVVAPQAPVAPVAPVAPAPIQQTPQEIALQAQVQSLGQQMAGLTAQIQQQQATTQLQQAQTDARVPAFNMQVPAQHMAALASEDAATRTAAMNDIINGVAQVVYAKATSEMDQRIETMAPQMQQQAQAATAAQDIKRDMYGTYPELNAMPDQVVAVANQMSNAGMFPQGWGPDFRDAIAERLAPLVPGLAEKVQLNKSTRMVPQQQVQQQVNLPQVQQLPGILPPGVAPAQVIGGVHVPVPQQGPMLVRDAYGNISQVFPQQAQQVVGSQVRPGGVSQGDPALQDIWSTLGFPT